MDTINPSEVLNGLLSAVNSLLPPIADPTLQPTLRLNAVQLLPTGLGGFIGMNDDPKGEIWGQRLNADVLMTVKAASASELNNAVTAHLNALLGQTRQTLLEHGILRLTLADLGGGAIAPGAAEQVLTFRIFYEFVKKPTEDEGVIQEIPISVNVG